MTVVGSRKPLTMAALAKAPAQSDPYRRSFYGMAP